MTKSRNSTPVELANALLAKNEAALNVLDPTFALLEAAKIEHCLTCQMVVQHPNPLESAQQAKEVLDAITKQFEAADAQLKAQFTIVRNKVDSAAVGIFSRLIHDFYFLLLESQKSYIEAKTKIKDDAIRQIFGAQENSLDQAEQITAAIKITMEVIETSNNTIKAIAEYHAATKKAAIDKSRDSSGRMCLLS